MATDRTPWRIGRTLLLAAVTTACAVRSSSPAVLHPAPFPAPLSPASIKPEPPGVVRVVAPSALTQTALSLRGIPYAWGGDRPSTGFDCSGFVQYVLAQHQIPLPRAAGEQFLFGSSVERTHIRAGDLVFFSTVAPGPSHVGLAINGEEFVHAPASSGVVRVERIHASYWYARYVGARRVF